MACDSESCSCIHTLLILGRDAGVIEVLQAMCHSKEILSSLVLRRDDKKALRDIKEQHGRVKCKKGTAGETFNFNGTSLALEVLLLFS